MKTPEMHQQLVYDFIDIFMMRDVDHVIPIAQCIEQIPSIEWFMHADVITAWEIAVRGFVDANQDGIRDNLRDKEYTAEEAAAEHAKYEAYRSVKP